MAKTPAKPTAVKKRPRDLLKATPLPIHPFDTEHGVDTSGLVPAKDLVTGHVHDEHVTAYYGVAPSILRNLVDHWLTHTHPPCEIDRYAFVDIGAGKGRALLVASEMPFREVLGVELNPALAAIARRNINHWTRTAPHLSPLRLVQADATTLELPHAPCLLFLFHPFEAPVLKRLLRNIESQFARSPGKLDLLYVNAECATVLDQHPAFRKLWSGKVPMTPADHAADLAAIAQQEEYGSTGDEECAIYRYISRGKPRPDRPRNSLTNRAGEEPSHRA
jgi:SAM-dependent methyltransferase